MPIPLPIAKPVFQIIYNAIRIVTKAKAPSIQRAVTHVDEKPRLAFDRLLDSALQSGPNTLIDYNLPYPKSDFLNYVCDWRGYVMHGSPLHDLETLQPIRKSNDISEFGNRQQIFASPDAMWAMWFAILDKDKYSLTNNGCIRLGHGENRIKFCYFGLPRNTRNEPPFTEGMIYIVRAADFPDKRHIPLLYQLNAEIEEWGSTAPVTPLARLKVKPEDFPYLDKVEFAS